MDGPAGSALAISRKDAQRLRVSTLQPEVPKPEPKPEFKVDSSIESKIEYPVKPVEPKAIEVKVDSLPDLIEIEGKNGEPSTWAHLFTCPGCSAPIQVMPNELNCFQFRCGDKLDPHAKKEDCEKAVAEKRTLGCGAAFWFDNKSKPKLTEYK